MAIESTVLYKEVLGVIASGPKLVHYKWRAEVVANKKVLAAMSVISIHRVRDYLNNYADDFRVELLFGAGDFIYDIYPYRRDLKIRLYGTPQFELKDGSDNRLKQLVYEGKAVPFDTIDPSVTLSEKTGMNKKAANISSVNPYSFQLIDPVVDELRLLQVGGIFHNQAPADVLRTLLTAYSTNLKFPVEEKPLGVGLAEPNNTARRKVIPLPHGLPLVDQADGTQGLAKYLQFKEGGIYNAGIGCYYQARHWYVYPLFDVTRYDKAKRKLTIVNVPEKDMRGIERSYVVKGNNVFIAACGQTKYSDGSDHTQLNHGNGVRFSPAMSLLDGFMTGDGNRAQADRSKNFSEFLGDQSENGLAYAPVSKQAITSNPYGELTQLAYKRGSMITLAWESANIDIITPGMPARVLIPNHGLTEILDGVVVAVEQATASTGRLGADDAWQQNAGITLFVTRAKIDKPK